MIPDHAALPADVIRKILAADRCKRGLHAWSGPSVFATCTACGAQR